MLTQALEQAVTLHRGGNLPQAEAIYRQVLAQAPQHAMAMHLLGVLAGQSQRIDEAIGLIRGAIAIEPNQAAFHANLGDLLRGTGRPTEARAALERALAIDPTSVVAHYNLGLLHQAENRPAAAIESFHSAIRLMPELAQAHNELGNLYRNQGNREQALAHFQQAVASSPNFADAYNDLGNLLQDLGRLNEAIAAFEHALQLRPTMWAAHYNLGNALRAAGRQQQALASYREALSFNPKFALAYNNSGIVLQDLGELDAAEQAFAAAVQLAPDLAEAQFNLGTRLAKRGDVQAAKGLLRRAIELDPRHAQSYCGLGSVCQRMHLWDEARHNYLESIRIDPSYAEPHCNLGIMAMNEGRYDNAQLHFDTSLSLRPECPEAHCNRGMLRLGGEDYAHGWPEYLWYSRCDSYHGRKFPRPIWDGKPLHEQTLRVVCDHGLGDTIQFVRYLPWLATQGAGHVLLAAQQSLHPLLAESGFTDLIAPEDDSAEFDTHISIMMLPALYHAATGSLGTFGPYLRPRQSLVERWKARLSDVEGFRIGIGWHGNNLFPWNAWRSVPLPQFAPLARVPGARLVVLQHGEGRDQLPLIKDSFDVVDLGAGVDRDGGAFMDTAAIIANLDLVITSDTSLAHVSAALGAPVWMPVCAAPEWRWRRHGDATPWYGSMRLFRQRALGDWSEVFQQMADELPKYLAGCRRPNSTPAQ